MSGFRRIHKLGATEVGYFFSHGRDLAGFEPRTFRFQGFPEGRSGCERISPDPLGYGATQQIGRNLKLIYPTLGLGPGHVPQRSDIFFPMEGIWRDLNPGPLDSRGFRRGGLDVSGFRRIHWATGPHSKLGEI